MGDVIPLTARRRRARKRIYFTRADLSGLMQLYSRRVASGEWRDYAIDHQPGLAAFSIFRHSSERPLYVIAKTGGGTDGEWLVYQGQRQLKRTRSLSEALAIFDRQVRLISS